ncbi:hypothetical protein AVEN_154912-1 [Araneus ventricosus]|uniref:Uncharacterized protein n=1 Tax=Araneus ventricosus TaxID=182803 RepID=A0A4Y2A6X7_ARAVE|nr:hypothetical protein AVEN_154912-1 [Araneus ventricosus]
MSDAFEVCSPLSYGSDVFAMKIISSNTLQAVRELFCSQVYMRTLRIETHEMVSVSSNNSERMPSSSGMFSVFRTSRCRCRFGFRLLLFDFPFHQ